MNETGFWSLTAYGADNFLIDNPYNIYALGDRSNITYPNGDRVYSTSTATANPDQEGSFQILVQAADTPPPENWTSNWLPAPAGGGDVIALLRFYEAGTKLLEGQYPYPVLSRIAAITNSSSSNTSGSTGSPTSSSRPGTSTGGAAMIVPGLLYAFMTFTAVLAISAL